ncbi:MAG: neutral zinc metallopeptidase [Hyphomicrobiales bacterium]
MKIRRRDSGDVIDQRGAGRATGLGGLPIPLALGGGLSLPILILIIVAMLIFGGGGLFGGGGSSGFGVDSPFNQFPAAAPAPDNSGQPFEPETPEEELVAFVVEDTQAFWSQQFAQAGMPYREVKLVLFEQAVNTACGPASSDTGPFYCPGDERMYIDLSFFRELAQRFGAPGDFAQAYVIAHEMGHHIQKLTGTNDQVSGLQQRNPNDANELSVRLELQADCLAGVWAHSTYERDLLESGDLEEGLTAAAAVGDDRLQREATGRVNPETWTHGSSEQRTRWFRTGFDSGSADSCDTFSGDV